MSQADTGKMAGFRKRQQITKTNKNIFIWVALAAVLVTVCIVVMQFLVRQLLFNQEIIGAKTTAQSIVVQNKQNTTELKKKIDALVADANLAKVKTDTVEGNTSSNLQVILDALPTTNDGATFANSLSKVILPQSGVSIESINVDSTAGAEVTATAAVSTVSPQTLGFTVSIQGGYDQVRQALVDLARVIRPISITKLSLQGDGNNLTASIAGVTYSLPPATVNLESKSLKP